jgi:hypothetical protein
MLHASRVSCKAKVRFYGQDVVSITEEWRYERTICAVFYMGEE